MKVQYREAKTGDVARCIEIRGMTRENPIPVEILKQFGVTEQSWKFEMEQKRTVGVILEHQDQVVGFCFGDIVMGEVQSLAVLPEFESHGYSKIMVSLITEKLFQLGFERLWLAASPSPEIRTHGFYRHLGWKPTGEKDKYGDELLEFTKHNNSYE